MKVLILGGYGVFGGRLARLLIRDGIEVVITGRNLKKASAFAGEIGGAALQLDIAGDLSPILQAAPNVVVDAAGPFQSYRADPYRLARFCIRHGMNYLDFSDDAGFAAGISALDREAQAAGCFALSGASSVPAISAAAARALSEGLSEILLIESAIVPGNRAPRGRSLISAILSQTGEPLRIWRGGRWRLHRGWSGMKTLSFGEFQRRASLIGVPDLKLFPPVFGARSVLFRAGLELGIMHWGLGLLGFLRAYKLLPRLSLFLGPIEWLSRKLEPFGSSRGAMLVEVTGLENGKSLRRRWLLLVNKGDGPFIPAVPARALIRKHDSIKPGARACLFDVTLGEIESGTAGLSVCTFLSGQPAPALFETVLEERWDELPGQIRELHCVQDVEDYAGQAQVTGGSGLLARCVAWLFNFPRAGENIALTVTKSAMRHGEKWERNFAGRRFRSCLSPSRRPFHIRERFFAFTFEQELAVAERSLSYTVRRGWFLGIPLPAFLLPWSKAREYVDCGGFHFDVALYAPLTGGLIVRYRGFLRPFTMDEEGPRLAQEPL